MHVLVLGANGFIGSTIVAALIRAGMKVTGLVRDPEKFKNRFSGIESIKADLRSETVCDSKFWTEKLGTIDAVVNAAGVLQPRRERDAWAVHFYALEALYSGCEQAGVRRFIQISAVGVEEAQTAFARSKSAADQNLMSRDLDWTILRPAIVIGDGSYGGTSMLRAIAVFPWITPVIGDGGTELDFIHKDDLADSIVEILLTGAAKRKVLEPASAERFTLLEAVRAYRHWLGLNACPVLKIPNPCLKFLATLGDFMKLDPITTTALAQFETRLTGNPDEFESATGIKPRGLTAILQSRPAESQDLWHARMYLVRPFIRVSLVVLWLTSGLLGLLSNPERYSSVLGPITENPNFSAALAMSMSLIDLAIAAALVIGWRLKGLANIQLVIVIGYTVALTLLAPTLWGDLYGGLLKNLPIIALILVHRFLEEER